MHRIDHNTRLIDGNGTGKDGFTEGAPGTTAATRITDDWLNDMQEEICGVIEIADTLVKGDQDQLKTAITKLLTDIALSNWATLTPTAVINFGASGCSPTQICLLESGGTKVHYSKEARNTWSAATLGGALNAIAYGNGYWVAVGNSGAMYYATDPAGSWTSNTQSPTKNIHSVYYANGYWVAVGDDGEIWYKATNPTGAWTTSTMGASAYYAVIYANGYWVAVGENGQLYYKATDPTGAWTSNTQGTTSWRCISYGLLNGVGTWVIGGYAGEIRSRTTLTGTWSTRTSAFGASSAISGAAYGANAVVLVGTDTTNGSKYAQYTFDGITFYSVCAGNSSNVNTVAYFRNAFIAAGDGGLLSKSMHVGRYLE